MKESSDYPKSRNILVKLDPSRVGLFRFLLEGYDNLACFTSLDKDRGVIKVFFSPDQEREVEEALQAISEVVKLEASFPSFFEEESFQRPL